MKEDPEKPRKIRRREENDEAPGTPVNDVRVNLSYVLYYYFILCVHCPNYRFVSNCLNLLSKFLGYM